MEESALVVTCLPASYDALAPAVLDVQTDGWREHIERHQGEDWVLTLMGSWPSNWAQCPRACRPTLE